ncbi:MAG: hypothetical protein ACK559_33030, partial [bacterium]
MARSVAWLRRDPPRASAAGGGSAATSVPAQRMPSVERPRTFRKNARGVMAGDSGEVGPTAMAAELVQFTGQEGVGPSV